ncbi:MAG: MFS transporter [Wenzhouxiangella sp.]|jgi:nitrate/nitrite transporter NarK|nr:MFS transporter [Wenzhouxiangella sp.]
MGSLILAGESIYMLPYLRKSFQTSMEATFGLSAFEVGTLNALFGILALLSYLPGGWLADRFSARRLLTLSLLATGTGGLYMATLPGYPGLLAVHAFWGVFSICTFWAALIKATRLWSPADEQGRAFGILDGGRGLVGALLASGAALAFGLSASVEGGLVHVIAIYSIAPILAGVAVWMLVPGDHETFAERSADKLGIRVVDSLKQTARIPEVWLITVVIFCAYLMFLGSYEFPAYAERGFDRSKEFGAWVGAFRDWLRPIAAIAAGIIADRVSPSRAISVLFAALAAGWASIAFLPPEASTIVLLGTQVAVVALAIFAIRGIYYALLEQSRIPLHLTGISVGAISMLAYTPDIFAALLSGWLVDTQSGVHGYRIYFGIMTVAAVVGLVATLAIAYRTEGNTKS